MKTNTDNEKAAGGQNVSKADFRVSNHGSILLFSPENAAADAHIRQNVSDEVMWYGGALVVEHRYANDLAKALMDEGFDVRKD